MGLIVPAAWLALCTCGQHGVIAFGDGSKSEKFFSKKDALTEVETALLAKKIIPAEAELLRQGIADSKIMTEEKIDAIRRIIAIIGHSHVGEMEGETQHSADPTLH